MSSREERGDLELERLFRSMDEVRASDELKASTLTAIFGQLDDAPADAPVDVPAEVLADAPADAPADVPADAPAKVPAVALADAEEREKTQTVARPTLVLVGDDGASDSDDAGVNEPTASVATGEGEGEAETDVAKKASRPRRRGFVLKVAAAVLVVAIGLGGVLSYAIPASHVTVSAGDTTFDLGVNVYGATVSATADSDAGNAAISSAEVRNVGFEDALGRLIDAYDRQRGGEQDEVQVSVHDPLGGGERFSNEANRVIEERRPVPVEPAEAPAQGSAPDGGPEPESFSPPAQDAGGPPDVAEGAGPVAEGELGGGMEIHDGGEVVTGGGGQEPAGGPMPGGGMEGSLGGMGEQSGMSEPGSAPQFGQGQGQGPGGAPR